MAAKGNSYSTITKPSGVLSIWYVLLCLGHLPYVLPFSPLNHQDLYFIEEEPGIQGFITSVNVTQANSWSGAYPCLLEA